MATGVVNKYGPQRPVLVYIIFEDYFFTAKAAMIFSATNSADAGF